MRLVRYIL